MGMNYQLHRAWVDTAKGVRQCQKADKVLQSGKVDSAAEHYGKALDYFGVAVQHLEQAEDDANVKAGRLIDDGNQQMAKAIDQWTDGDVNSAERHYDKALDKYDEALGLVS